MAVGAKQIALSCTAFGCCTCLFYESSVASAIRSVPRHENRTESTSANLIFVDQIIPAEKREILAKQETRWSFLLIVRNFEKTLLYNSRSVKSSKHPAKKNRWPCWPLYLFMWARKRCRSKKNLSLISNRTSHLTSNNFRRTNEKFVQLHARHFKITNFFLPFWSNAGLSCGLDSSGVTSAVVAWRIIKSR